MPAEDVIQAVEAEIRSILREDWSMTRLDGSLQVDGPVESSRAVRRIEMGIRCTNRCLKQ